MPHLVMTVLVAGLLGVATPAQAMAPVVVSSVGAQVTCRGQVATIVGTGEADTLEGTEGDDVIAGLARGDVIHGNGGNDLICGGWGADTISGGPGDDRVYGGTDFAARGFTEGDVIAGGPGSDVLDAGLDDSGVVGEVGYADEPAPIQADLGASPRFGIVATSTGTDHVRRYDGLSFVAGPWADSVAGTDGPDTVDGGAGDDHLQTLGGPDNVAGGLGDDVALAGAGDDTIVDGFEPADGDDDYHGGGGADFLVAEAGTDVLHGDAGNDLFSALYAEGPAQVYGGAGNDFVNAVPFVDGLLVDGGAGRDRMDLQVGYDRSGSRQVVTVDLRAGTATTDISGAVVRVAGFERTVIDRHDVGPRMTAYFYGTPGNDIVSAPGVGTLWAWTYAGDDVLEGTIGDDALFGGAGTDSADGLGGTDRCVSVERRTSCER
jgi:Ca2+-binding RTX toxin-like protein